MFGIVDVGVGNDANDVDFRVDGGEGKTIELPSIWGIKGSKDFGGGLTASFALESIWTPLQVEQTEVVQLYLITVHAFGPDKQTFPCQMKWVASH